MQRSGIVGAADRELVRVGLAVGSALETPGTAAAIAARVLDCAADDLVRAGTEDDVRVSRLPAIPQRLRQHAVVDPLAIALP